MQGWVTQSGGGWACRALQRGQKSGVTSVVRKGGDPHAPCKSLTAHRTWPGSTHDRNTHPWASLTWRGPGCHPMVTAPDPTLLYSVSGACH